MKMKICGITQMEKLILDPCCGSRMFYFDKENPIVMFCDNREFEDEQIWKSGNGRQKRYCTVKPEVVSDFTHLPFDDESFYHVVFDPPHLIRGADTAWMVKKYGRLPIEWEDAIKKGFDECIRVLKPYGTLIFKWNEVQIPTRKVIDVIGVEPIYGHKSGKQSKTHWMMFMKMPEQIKERVV